MTTEPLLQFLPEASKHGSCIDNGEIRGTGVLGTRGVGIRKAFLKPNGKYLFLIEIGKVSQEGCVCTLYVCVCIHICVCFYRYVCANGRQKLASGVFLCCFLLVLSLSLNAISLN